MPDSLPASLEVRTSCGEFLVDRSGSVHLVSTDPFPVPRNVGWLPNGTWIMGKHGHVIVGRWHQTLWRSTDRVAHASAVDDVVVGKGELAFSTYWHSSRLYLAKPDGRARLVARHEFPLGWTSSGLYVGRNQDGAVLLRSGNRARRLSGANVRTAVYDGATRSLYFVARGRLYRAQGSQKHPVAALTQLGLRSERSLQVQLLGRLVALQGAHQLVVLRRDGSLLASTPLPSRRRNMIFSGQPTASPRGAAVAFAVLRPDHAIESQRTERGVETVYLLRSGMRAAVPVHTRHMRFNVCGHGANLTWHGDWLLYTTGEGPAALIETSGAHVIDLTALVRRLPGFRGVDESGPLSLAWR
jgi:hypothetical protein